MAKHQFQTEVNQLLNLMIHSLYSNKEIFLRELISNSSDAIDKLQFLTMTDDKYKSLSFEPNILIKFDEEKRVLSISDNGIGMNSEDLVEHLGTIAKSGTKSFLEKLTGDAKKDSNLIGQFGVGFYSAFMVAEKIEVKSKKALEEKAYSWVSDGSGGYEIEECQKGEFGTEITLYLKEDESEFLNEHRISGVVQKYSNHIPFPIKLRKFTERVLEEDKDKKPEEQRKEKVEEIEQINKASALWRLSKSELKDEDYNEFYKTISHDSDDPLLHIHTKLEGTLEYTTLFYIPKKAPFDMFRVDYQAGVKLYIKRVFITDDEKELMPTYLRFLKGVIDSEDLPLNVSREILQHNAILAKIKKSSVKKVLDELKKLSNKDSEKYLQFWREYGRVMKEGLYSDFENKDTLLELARFKSLNQDGLISLAEYKESMKVDQKEIYYITGENENILRNSPLIEAFKERGFDVLILDDEVDSIVMPMVTEYKETKIVPITEAKLEDEKEEDNSSYEDIIKRVKESLANEVKDVKISQRLSNSPSCITFDSSDPNYQMQKMMKQMGQLDNMPEIKPILEINPKSEIFKKLIDSKDIESETFENIVKLILDEAKLLEGEKIEDVVGFIERLNKIITKAI